MNDPQRVVTLAHKKFPDRARTVTDVLRYADYDVVTVFGCDSPGTTAADHRRDLPGVPAVVSMVDAFDADALLVGIPPIGGAFDETWHDDVRTALERGCDFISGLHYLLTEGKEFVRFADGHGYDINDACKSHDDLDAAQGRSADMDAEIVLTVGTDCSVGKTTMILELVETTRERGIDADFIPTDQTGIMVAGWDNPVDHVISDFTAGAVEEMILEKGDERDALFVKGQGNIVHLAYSAVICGILYGVMTDKPVLYHEAIHKVIHGYEEFAPSGLSEHVSLYENLADPVHETDVVAGMPDTFHVDDGVEVAETVDAFADELGIPTVDPVRFGSTDLIDGVF